MNVPSSQNSISQNAKEIPKELEENNNNNNIDKNENNNNIYKNENNINNIDKNENINNINNIDKKENCNNIINIDIKENSFNSRNYFDGIQISRRKSASNSVNSNNISEDKNEVKLFIKSNTFSKHTNKNTKINNNSNEHPQDDSKEKIQKAKTCNELDKINFSVGLNNVGQNHLGTVLEAINEVSNSNVDSSEISIDEDENKKIM